MNYNQYAFSKRNRILRTNAIDSYDVFLRSDIWKKIRALFNKKRINNPYWQSCHGCTSKINLQLHHMRYKNINLTKVTLNNIIPLCNLCHKQLHLISRAKNISFKLALRELKKQYEIKMDRRKTE
jgi:hypothetical protein